MTAAELDPDLVGFLGRVPLLDGLDEALLRRLAAAAEVVHLPAGAWLFHQGDAGDRLYVVRSGRLEVLHEPAGGPGGPGGEPRVIGLLERGAVLGELALLTGGTRAAGVRARRESELLTVRRADFENLLDTEPGFARALTAALGAQLQRTGATLAEAPRRKAVLTVLPLDAAVPAAELLRPFAEALGPVERTAVLDRGAAADVPPDAVAAAGGRLLDRMERDHDTVLLVAEPPGGRLPDPSTPAGAWTDFCLRQADHVVVLATPATRPPTGPLAERLRGCDLVVVSHAPPSAPMLTPWLDGLAPRSHHRVRTGVGGQVGEAARRGVRRAARRLTGRSIGVVLSGGGARGYAHIGALAALEEAGVTIDRVGGTSMGALIAGLYAVGWSPEQIQRRCRAELAERRPFADYTVPRHALLDGRRGRRMLVRLFSDRHVEELALDWFAVSCDLRTAEVVVHRRGPVADAVAASISLPGLAPPFPSGDRLLVDGGVLNNLPVDVMAATGEGPVVGVDVMRRWSDAFAAPAPVRAGGSGGVVDAVGRRLRRAPIVPAAAALPSIRETLTASTSLGSSRAGEENRRIARMVIAPDLAGIQLLDWGNLDAIVEAGRRAARAALAADPLTTPAT